MFINSLGGFPGQYSSFVFRTLGNDGILKLLSESIDRSAYFLSLIAFYDGRVLSIHEGRVNGRITDRMIEGGWGYDPIFAPDNSDLTFAELKEDKNEYSHRKRALEKFARWYLKLMQNHTQGNILDEPRI